MRCKMDCAAFTDVGRVRQTNEDQFLIADLNKSMLVRQTSLFQDDHTRLFGSSQGALLLVADGMGGHAAGKQASALAVQTLEHYILNTMPWFFHLQQNQETDLQDELKSAMEACQKSIETAARARPEQRGMGTTLTMAYLLWPRLYVVHVGDSRCYLFRSPRLEQITKDQTMAQQLAEQGVLAPEEVPQSRWSHVLWSCLGGHTRQLSVEVYKAALTVGDTLLLCTDGLTRHLSDEDVLRLLQRRGSAEQTCRRLVAAANDAGGSDNVTVVVARFLDAHSPEALVAHAEEKTAHPRTASEVADVMKADEEFINAGVRK
ncbi:MAG TPA: protein phosphatase 2C domain-containing protein [Gemmataceae bacterium]|nr:protein phosphatase 2C domain-containing protein [Gemmataceae bacterium]